MHDFVQNTLLRVNRVREFTQNTLFRGELNNLFSNFLYNIFIGIGFEVVRASKFKFQIRLNLSLQRGLSVPDTDESRERCTRRPAHSLEFELEREKSLFCWGKGRLFGLVSPKPESRLWSYEIFAHY